eukprot:SAG22_NODE_722_length_7641_cov_13.307876_4_plen_126_part_00
MNKDLIRAKLSDTLDSIHALKKILVSGLEHENLYDIDLDAYKRREDLDKLTGGIYGDPPAGASMYDDPSSTGASMYDDPSSTGASMYDDPSSAGGSMYDDPSGGGIYGDPPPPGGSMYDDPSGGR